jgi:hypothetical protein
MTASTRWRCDDDSAQDSDPLEHRIRWSVIAQRTIYFGHQSVGTSVCAGVEELSQAHGMPLQVVRTRDPEAFPGPAFVHFLAGRHRDYASKNASLLRLLESSTRARDPIVLLKYCHGDISSFHESTMLFDAYCETVDAIRFEHPDVTLIHATIPLVTTIESLRERAKRYMGRPTARESAIARHRYNELVRNEFGLSEPIFDVARIQSTGVGGTRAGFNADGTVIETSAVENTSDGGSDLSASCRIAAAESLLEVISTAIESR